MQQGFLSRAVGRSDRRAAHVSLTPRSRRLLADYDQKRREKLAKVFRGCSGQRPAKLAKLMDQRDGGDRESQC